MKTFEDYLQGKFMEECPMVLDDDLENAFDSWLVNIDIDEIIEYADLFGELKEEEGYRNCIIKLKK